MPAKLHHTLRNLASVTATSAAVSYPATNIKESPVDKPWRSTTNALQNVDIDLGSSLAVTAIAVQGTNAPSITVLADAAINPPTTNRGTLALAQDPVARRKGILEVAATVRYIRLQIPATSVVADDDGTVQAYYWIGAVYVFGATLNLPRDPLYGSSALEAVYPQTSVDLANGQNVTSNDGAPYAEPTLAFSVRSDQDIERAARLARLGVCWLDLGIASERARQWPVRHVQPRLVRRVTRVNGEQVELKLREIA
jgi:hypothetical protein